MKKRNILLTAVLSVLTVILLVASCGISLHAAVNAPDLRAIQTTRLFGKTRVTISCNGCERYLVEPVAKDATVYQDCKPLPLNEDLGDYRMAIKLCDSRVSAEFRDVYEPFTTYSLTEDGSLKFMYLLSSDHAVEIYVGSEKPISVKTGEFSNAFYPFQKITVTISE